MNTFFDTTLYRLSLAVASVLGFLLLAVSSASAAQLSGYAWSPNVGWISFSCLNTGYCDQVDYGVTIDDDQNLVGWAWSPNVGWIDMSNGQFNEAAGTLAGEVLAVSGGVENDGWDGTITLADNGSVSYGPVLDESDDIFDGYAWGGEVVGWIRFSCQTDDSCTDANYGVRIDPFMFSFTSDAGLLVEEPAEQFTDVTLIWETNGADNCTASGGAGTNWADSPDKAVNGTHVIDQIEATTTFFLTCTGDGDSIERQVTVHVRLPQPVVTLWADNTNLDDGETTFLRWDTENVDSCTAAGSWSGGKSVGMGNSEQIGPLTEYFNLYTLQCIDIYGNGIFDEVVVYQQALDLSLTVNQNTLRTTGEITLTWDPQYATSCVADDNTASTTWDGARAAGPGPHSEVVSNLEVGNRYDFAMTCYGAFGQEITVNALVNYQKIPGFIED